MKNVLIVTYFILIFCATSCGKKVVREYSTEPWGQKIYTLTSDTSGYCVIGVGVNSEKNILYSTLGYYSSYQTANELICLDYDIITGDAKLNAESEKYTADDSNYKLLVGTENTITLKSGEDWNKLGTQLKIDTVKNEYLPFKVSITKKHKIKGELPDNIVFSIHSKTTLGVKDTSLQMKYREYEDNSAPIRVH